MQLKPQPVRRQALKPTDIEIIIKTEGIESVRVIIDVNIKKIKRKRIDITLNANTIEMIDFVTGNIEASF